MIDINKKYKTLDGREVILYTIEGKGGRPVVGQVKSPHSGIWTSMSWDSKGLCGSCTWRLVEVKEEKEGWVNIYHSCRSIFYSYVGNTIYKEEKEAVSVGLKQDNYVDTIKIEWEE